MTAITAGGMAQAEALLEQAMAAPRGVSVPFADADHGGNAGAFRNAKLWRDRLYALRSSSRKKMARLRQHEGFVSSAADPDVVPTEYDGFMAEIVRDDTGALWLLKILKVLPVGEMFPGIKEL